jgi:tetratricopeptide (TPR) repeat protein
MDRSRRTGRLSALALLLSFACAPGARGPTQPAPGDVPALEAQYRNAPGDVALRTQLAAAYRAADRAQDAVALLEPVAAGDVTEHTTAVTLAGAYEDLSRFDDARAIYTRLTSSTSGRLQREVRARLLALGRLELRHAVRQSIAREAELRNTAPATNTVGVFPFLFAATNEELRPLSRALAELLSVDLAQTNRLRVVERAQVQFLLDELQLAESSRVDTLTAARAGRLIGAGRIVQGRIDGDIRLQAALVQVPTAEGVRVLTSQGALNTLFDLEKQMALGVYQALGVELTVAERQRVNRRPTENLQALLAFGYGLEAADAGRYEEAQEWFERARNLDSGFVMPQEWSARVEAERAVEQQGPQGLYQIAGGGSGASRGDMPTWVSTRQPFIDVERMIPNPQGRDAVPEVLGTEGLERGIILELIIRRPVGGGN